MFVDEADYLQSMITEFEARCQQPTYADRRALQLSSQSSIDECDIENDDDFVGVNCFPGRPPTSLYVTNESPTIWFQPKEVWEVRVAFDSIHMNLLQVLF